MKYKFTKDWASYKKGQEVETENPVANKLVKDGFLKKIEPKVAQRKKKVELETDKLKK